MTKAEKISSDLTKLYGKRAVLDKQIVNLQKKVAAGAKVPAQAAKPKAKKAVKKAGKPKAAPVKTGA